MSNFPDVLKNISACASGLTAHVDDAVNRLKAMESDMVRCDEELKAKQVAADKQIEKLRAELQHLREERAKAERELELVRKNIEREKKEVGREWENLRKGIAHIMTSSRAA
jgi:chromosome segregation ATPase